MSHTPGPGVAPVTCLGGVVLDHKLHLLRAPVAATSNPARAVTGDGGVARNVAENLARLGVAVRLVSRVGDDPAGARLCGALGALGVDVRGVRVVPDAVTASYLAVLDPDGELVIGAAAMDVLDGFGVEDVDAAWPDRGWLFTDCNVPAAALGRIVARAADDPGVRLAVDAVSALKVRRLPADLHGVDLLFGNRDEVRALLDRPGAGPSVRPSVGTGGPVPVGSRAEPADPADPADPAELAELAEPAELAELARALLAHGAGAVVLTRGAAGVLLADADGVREVPAVPARVRDVTGAGDALVAGVLAGLAAGEGLTRAAAVGTLVAAHTVRSEGSVCPDLSAGLVGLAGSPGESFRVREEQQ